VGTLIDSSVLIATERQALHLDAAMVAFADEPVGMAAITASELLHGVHRAASAAQRQRRETFVERLLAVLPVLPFDLVTAR
jgi:tRNA(fMet)-specific endonuclease VapC